MKFGLVQHLPQFVQGEPGGNLGFSAISLAQVKQQTIQQISGQPRHHG
jgi:hypothetical protein